MQLQVRSIGTSTGAAKTTIISKYIIFDLKHLEAVERFHSKNSFVPHHLPQQRRPKKVSLQPHRLVFTIIYCNKSSISSLS